MSDVGWPWVVALGLSAAAASVGLSRWTLPRLAEPDAPDPPDKIPYRDLDRPRFVLGVAALTGLAATASALSLTAGVQPIWWVLAVTGALLVAVDARTTWLPLALTQVAWIGMAVALGVSVLVTGGDWSVPGRAAAGAGLAGALYWLVWRFSRGGIGYGDVRFAPVIGSAAAAYSWPLLVWALLLASVVGGVHGLARLAQRRPGGFPYAPSMLIGTYAACLTEWWG